jgi:hypothetical protein
VNFPVTGPGEVDELLSAALQAAACVWQHFNHFEKMQ